MKFKSILIVIDKYPASFGHTTVIKETSVRLQKIGYKVGIAAFSFKEEPPLNIEKIILDNGGEFTFPPQISLNEIASIVY